MKCKTRAIINDFFKNAIFGIPLFMLVVSPAARLFINKYIDPKHNDDVLC